ncbi:MAG: hypothetical protein R3C53_13095 [Pirellulaceae bacterium]
MQSAIQWLRGLLPALAFSTVAATGISVAGADFPPFDKVIEGFKKVEAPDNGTSMYTLYTDEDAGQLLIELPKNYGNKKYFFGMTVASGQIFAGLQAGDYYVEWRQYNQRLALISPNIGVRSGAMKNQKTP